MMLAASSFSLYYLRYSLKEKNYDPRNKLQVYSSKVIVCVFSFWHKIKASTLLPYSIYCCYCSYFIPFIVAATFVITALDWKLFIDAYKLYFEKKKYESGIIER